VEGSDTAKEILVTNIFVDEKNNIKLLYHHKKISILAKIIFI